MTPTFKGKFEPIYEPPYLPPATRRAQHRRAYLKHREWVVPVLFVLAVIALCVGAGLALLNVQAPQL